jgi:hypothetical protein
MKSLKFIRAASTLLEQIDAHFGGLAAPKSVELDLKINRDPGSVP